MPSFSTERVAHAGQWRYITHARSGDHFVFELANGHIWSVGIDAGNIDWYYDLLGRGACQFGHTVGEIGPTGARHTAAHNAGVRYGSTHSHWGSLRGSGPDGITTLLTKLSVRIGMGTCMQVRAMAKNPGAYPNG